MRTSLPDSRRQPHQHRPSRRGVDGAMLPLKRAESPILPFEKRARGSLAYSRAMNDRYVDEGVIGQGGMGTVHRVYDRQLLRRCAMKVLAPGGCFVAKVFQGGSEREMLAPMKLAFETVRHAKPPASRKESSELYVVATGFRGNHDRP